ncbi:MAG: hypothetical protein GY797_39795 [Deltaproteobacteria bacterium]|nr:hypothetical protein [Deltaproteobacteria bacterium]
MKKKLPILKSDIEAEGFVEKVELAKYDLSGGKSVHFEFQKKDKAVQAPKK